MMQTEINSRGVPYFTQPLKEEEPTHTGRKGCTLQLPPKPAWIKHEAYPLEEGDLPHAHITHCIPTRTQHTQPYTNKAYKSMNHIMHPIQQPLFRDTTGDQHTIATHAKPLLGSSKKLGPLLWKRLWRWGQSMRFPSRALGGVCRYP